MPLPFSLPQTYGKVLGVPISGASNAGTWQLVFVTLSAAYARSPPPGYPVPPGGGLIASSQTAFAQTIPQGTRLGLFSDEAAALVAAGAAAYS